MFNYGHLLMISKIIKYIHIPFTLFLDEFTPHPFPTRRSSDLPRSPPRAAEGSSESSRASAAKSSPWAARWAKTSRSEEHTSELQSPCNLVCRLLLEKKKMWMIRIKIL